MRRPRSPMPRTTLRRPIPIPERIWERVMSPGAWRRPTSGPLYWTAKWLAWHEGLPGAPPVPEHRYRQTRRRRGRKFPTLEVQRVITKDPPP